MAIKYVNPPINELIIGLYFNQPITPLRSEHVGLFWSRVRKEFPTIRPQPELALPLAGPMFSLQLEFAESLYPTPRFWLEFSENSYLIQIQKNAFLLNWRKGASSYPHFDNVKRKFDEYYNLFCSFLTDELDTAVPAIQLSELQYSNVIESGEYWREANDTQIVLPSIVLPTPGISVEGSPDFNYLTTFKHASDLTLHFGARTGRVAADPSKSVLMFDFRTIGALGATGKPEADAWFERAHAIIGRCFTSLTSPDIQVRYWQPE